MALVKVAGRRRERPLMLLLASLCAASVAAQLYWAQTDVAHAYYGTDARLYQLLAGALLAVALRNRPGLDPVGCAGPLASVGLVALVIMASGLVGWSPSVRGLGATVASVAAIAGLVSDEKGFVAAMLSRRVPVFLGKISYGTYLWHWPVIVVLGEVVAVSPAVLAVLAAAISTGLAALSYEVLEMPIRTSAC